MRDEVNTEWLMAFAMLPQVRCKFTYESNFQEKAKKGNLRSEKIWKYCSSIVLRSLRSSWRPQHWLWNMSPVSRTLSLPLNVVYMFWLRLMSRAGTWERKRKTCGGNLLVIFCCTKSFSNSVAICRLYLLYGYSVFIQTHKHAALNDELIFHRF